MDSSASASSSNANAGTGSFGMRRNSNTMFQSLIDEKKPSDAAAMARRQSFHDQRPQPGFFGQMWQNYTRGSIKPSK